MSAKQDVIGKLESEYDAFRSTIAGLPEEAYSEQWLGEWNLDQVLAHMAGWWVEMSGAFERVARGERPVPEGVDYSDADRWNAGFAADARHGTAALQTWDDAFTKYANAAKGLNEDLFGVDPERGRPRIGDRLLDASGIAHLGEHRPQVEEWLAGR
jgi:hypothetical protein